MRSKYLLDIPCIHAGDILADAYKVGCVNWNVYQKALEKITSNKNGSWMFEKRNVNIDFEKLYEDD